MPVASGPVQSRSPLPTIPVAEIPLPEADPSAPTFASPSLSPLTPSPLVPSPDPVANAPLNPPLLVTSSLSATAPTISSKRWLKATAAITLGTSTLALGASSLGYRLLHFQVGGGVISGRLATIQSPADGTIQRFYARPGATVQPGQVLAQLAIAPPATDPQDLLQAQAEAQQLSQDRQQAQQMLQLLRSQQAQFDQQAQTWQRTKAAAVVAAAQSAPNQPIAPSPAQLRHTAQLSTAQLQEVAERQQSTINRLQRDLARQQSTIRRWAAALQAETAAAEAARLEHQRYKDLWQQGVVAQQKVEALHATWQAAQAKVEEAQANWEQARADQTYLTTELAAARKMPQQTARTPQPQATVASTQRPPQPDQSSTLTSPPITLPEWIKLQETQQDFEQAIQTQTAKLASLDTQWQQAKKRLAQARDRQATPQLLAVRAPIAGVVYRTNHDWGEQVSRPDRLLTLVDCQDLWAEVFVTANQASQIDEQAPVRVQLAGKTNTLLGRIDRLEAVGQLEHLRSQTAGPLPTVTPVLAREPLMRVIVRVPELPAQGKGQQLCGVGQATTMTFGTQLARQPLWQQLPVIGSILKW